MTQKVLWYAVVCLFVGVWNSSIEVALATPFPPPNVTLEGSDGAYFYGKQTQAFGPFVVENAWCGSSSSSVTVSPGFNLLTDAVDVADVEGFGFCLVESLTFLNETVTAVANLNLLSGQVMFSQLDIVGNFDSDGFGSLVALSGRFHLPILSAGRTPTLYDTGIETPLPATFALFSLGLLFQAFVTSARRGFEKTLSLFGSASSLPKVGKPVA